METRDIGWLTAAGIGALLFWSSFASVMRPPEPHPGLTDDELQEALREDWTHDALSYWKARKTLFQKIDGDGRQAEGRYTGEKLEYFSQPLPNSGTMEHAWPLTRLPAEARTDLHHLFPVIPEARVARVNLRYGNVMFAVWSRGGSQAGPSSHVKPVFEVRKKYRGDVARAMFYIATMYDLEIPDREEKTLRDWHHDDKVSREERDRNERVERHQESRNPFIDHPKLTKRISDF